MSTLRNRVQLIGHVGLEPEIKTLENGSRVATLRIATNESFKMQNGEWKEETYWHAIIAWNQLADKMQQQLTKGTYVMIEGRLTNRTYVDAAGIKKYVTEIKAISMLRLDKKASTMSEQDMESHEIVEEDTLPF